MTRPDFVFASLLEPITGIEQASVSAFQGMFVLQWERFMWGLSPDEWSQLAAMVAAAESVRAAMPAEQLSAILDKE